MPQEFDNGVALASSPTKTLIEVGGLIQAVDFSTEVATPGIDPATVAYTPAVPADWPENPDPTEVEQAIDLLAARTALLGGGGQVITDTQAASASNTISTTSSTFVTVPDMELTTDNEGGTNIYVVMFNCEFEMSQPNKTLTFIVEIGGVEEVSSQRAIEISSSNSPNNGGTFAWKASVGDGVVIRVKWKRSSGTATMLGRTLIIQGSE